jgi:hypothetical protein
LFKYARIKLQNVPPTKKRSKFFLIAPHAEFPLFPINTPKKKRKKSKGFPRCKRLVVQFDESFFGRSSRPDKTDRQEQVKYSRKV